MPALTDWLETLPPDHLAVATRVLDEVSRPLTPREIEAALRGHGVPKPRAVILGSSLKKIHIIALVGPEEEQ